MIAVSAGMVFRDGKIMLCQRKAGSELGLKWEFPGGKLEPGERPEEALTRELKEELDIETRVTGYFTSRRVNNGRDLLILFFTAEIVSGEPRIVDCADIAWVDPGRMTEYDLAPSDRSAAEEYLRAMA